IIDKIILIFIFVSNKGKLIIVSKVINDMKVKTSYLTLFINIICWYLIGIPLKRQEMFLRNFVKSLSEEPNPIKPKNNNIKHIES
ncbi:hypothetical protein, partial [Oenococcus oeni]